MEISNPILFEPKKRFVLGFYGPVTKSCIDCDIIREERDGLSVFDTMQGILNLIDKDVDYICIPYLHFTQPLEAYLFERFVDLVAISLLSLGDDAPTIKVDRVIPKNRKLDQLLPLLLNDEAIGKDFQCTFFRGKHQKGYTFEFNEKFILKLFDLGQKFFGLEIGGPIFKPDKQEFQLNGNKLAVASTSCFAKDLDKERIMDVNRYMIDFGHLENYVFDLDYRVEYFFSDIRIVQLEVSNRMKQELGLGTQDETNNFSPV
jgi:hypothetical protein